MLNIHFFTFNAFEENTYLIMNEHKQCWIVDPGMYGDQETAQLTDYIASKQLVPQAIINTHTHLDHIFGVQALMDKYHIPFGVHELEMPVLNAGAATAAMFGFEFPAIPKPTFFIKEGELMRLGKDIVLVSHTPGHSPGSISFYYPEGNWVIAGDVLFAGSIGRTDLPGGSYDTLISSIRKQLFALPGETVLLPGHGPASHIGDEEKNNPFLK